MFKKVIPKNNISKKTIIKNKNLFRLLNTAGCIRHLDTSNMLLHELFTRRVTS